ncbi:PilW family protein [Candidatus Latescibacterota bacterium]
MTKKSRRQDGFTLIEMVVAMVISLILVAGIFQFFTVQSRNFLEGRANAEMQQELRWSMDYLSDHLRQIGNGVPPTCGWPVVENTDGAGGAPDSISVLGSYRNLVVTTTQPMGNEGLPVKVSDTSEIEVGDLIVISDGTWQELFYVTAKNNEVLFHTAHLPWNTSKFLEHKYIKDSTVTVVTHASFFVDVDEEGRSNLMIQTQSYAPQVLLGDVDDFQIRFKMKDGSWFDEIYPDEIYDIRMIEIMLRARSTKPIKGYIDPVYGDGYKRIELKRVVIPKNITVVS